MLASALPYTALCTCRGGQDLFAMPQTPYPELDATRRELALLDSLYTLYREVMNTEAEWSTILWSDVVVNVSDMSAGACVSSPVHHPAVVVASLALLCFHPSLCRNGHVFHALPTPAARRAVVGCVQTVEAED